MTERLRQNRSAKCNGIMFKIICVALIAVLIVTILFFMTFVKNLQSQLAEKDNIISSLNSQISNIQNSLAVKESQIESLKSQISSLFNYLALNASTVLFYDVLTQNANSCTTIWSDVLQFAGYVAVTVQSSSNKTYIEISYSSFGVDYNETVIVGMYGVAAFPVLPAVVEIRVGNMNTNASIVTMAIKAVYHY